MTLTRWTGKESMDHMQFKANQTAAAYVAHELDEHQQEAFEIHMMGCSECLNDVEAWRVIKTHLPDAIVIEPARQFKKHWWGGWAHGGVLRRRAGRARRRAAPSTAARCSGLTSTPAKPRFSTCSRSRARKAARSCRVAANTRAVVLRMTKVDSERHAARDQPRRHGAGREPVQRARSARRQLGASLPAGDI